MIIKTFKILVLGVLLSSNLLSGEFRDDLTVVRTKEQFQSIPSIHQSVFEYLKSPNLSQNTTRIIFVRHGESVSNTQKGAAGRTLDSDLTEKGISQAVEVGKLLNSTGIKFDVAFSSPMMRTTKTLDCIFIQQNPSNIPLFFDEKLHEKWHGPYEGATAEQYAVIKTIEETQIPLLKTFQEKFHFKAHPEVESMAEVHSRLVDFIKDVHAHFASKNILVGTHNGVMKSLFMADSALRGFDVEYRTYDLDNCGIIVVEVDSANDFHVVATHGLKFRTKL